MTKNQIIKVLKAHLYVFEDVKFRYDCGHVLVFHNDPSDIWAAAEIECVVNVCRGLKLSYYIDKNGFNIYSNSYSAL